MQAILKKKLNKVILILITILFLTSCEKQEVIEEVYIPCESVAFKDKEVILLDIEEPYKFEYEIYPLESLGNQFTISSSNNEIAKVEGDKIVPVSEGECDITICIDEVSDSFHVQIIHSNYYGKEITFESKDGLTIIDNVLIVNKSYSLPKDYDPIDLLPEVKQAFEAMQKDAEKDGITLTAISTYRSYEYQTRSFNRWSARYGKDAEKISAKPGHSEHQTGLAIDVNSLETTFANTKEGKWLYEHCSDYGFIIRYPKDKEEYTGFAYEPWHIRYLGTKKAKIIEASGLCLEEYYNIDSIYKED